MDYLQILGSILKSIEVCAYIWLYIKSQYSHILAVLIAAMNDSFSLFLSENPYWQTLHNIKFSATQYEIIYWSLVTDDDTSVLNTLQNVRWAVTAEYPDEWFNDSDHSPSHYRCTQ